MHEGPHSPMAQDPNDPDRKLIEDALLRAQSKHASEQKPDALNAQTLQPAIDPAVVINTGRTGEHKRVKDALQRSRPFDIGQYERLLEQPRCREITADDMPAIGRLYLNSQMSTEVFLYYMLGFHDDADTIARAGGMIDEWNTTDSDTLNALQEASREKYVQSQKEFGEFLEHTYNRAAEFKAWGLFDEAGDLSAMVSAFLPPKDTEKRAEHAKELLRFFQGKNKKVKFFPRADFRIDLLQDKLENTAELYLITSKIPGGGTVVCDHMLQELQQSGISTWYLLRFGSLRMIKPDEDQRLVGDSENEASGKFFRRRNFNNYGTCRIKDQVAARKIDDRVVVVEPTWNIMIGSDEKFRNGNQTEMLYIASQAEVERQKK